MLKDMKPGVAARVKNLKESGYRAYTTAPGEIMSFFLFE
jgi:hypothetical protein